MGGSVSMDFIGAVLQAKNEEGLAELQKLINKHKEAKLEEKEANLTQQEDEFQRNALTIAAGFCNDSKAQHIKLLVDEAKFNIEKSTDSTVGDHALHLACRSYALQHVKMLCERGADVTAKNKHGHTPLMIACDDPAVNEKIITPVAKDSAENVHQGFIRNFSKSVSTESQVEIVRELLSSGAGVSQTVPETDETALHFASSIRGHFDAAAQICSELIANRANVNAEMKPFKSPAELAAFMSKIDCIAYEGDSNLPVHQNISSRIGFSFSAPSSVKLHATCLNRAAHAGNSKTVSMLIAGGADKSKIDPITRISPLFASFLYNKDDTNSSATSENIHERVEIMRILLSHGARPFVPRIFAGDNRSLFEYCIKRGHIDQARMLLDIKHGSQQISSLERATAFPYKWIRASNSSNTIEALAYDTTVIVTGSSTTESFSSEDSSGSAKISLIKVAEFSYKEALFSSLLVHSNEYVKFSCDSKIMGVACGEGIAFFHVSTGLRAGWRHNLSGNKAVIRDFVFSKKFCNVCYCVTTGGELRRFIIPEGGYCLVVPEKKTSQNSSKQQTSNKNSIVLREDSFSMSADIDTRHLPVSLDVNGEHDEYFAVGVNDQKVSVIFYAQNINEKDLELIKQQQQPQGSSKKNYSVFPVKSEQDSKDHFAFSLVRKNFAALGSSTLHLAYSPPSNGSSSTTKARTVWVSTTDKHLYEVDTSTGKIVSPQEFHDAFNHHHSVDYPSIMDVSADGKFVLSGGNENVIRVYTATAPQKLVASFGHTSANRMALIINDAKFCPVNSNLIAVCGHYKSGRGLTVLYEIQNNGGASVIATFSPSDVGENQKKTTNSGEALEETATEQQLRTLCWSEDGNVFNVLSSDGFLHAVAVIGASSESTKTLKNVFVEYKDKLTIPEEYQQNGDLEKEQADFPEVASIPSQVVHVEFVNETVLDIIGCCGRKRRLDLSKL